MVKAQQKLGRHAEAESELARAKQLRGQQPEPGSRQIPDAISASGSVEAASFSRSGQARAALHVAAPHRKNLTSLALKRPNSLRAFPRC